MNIVPFTPVPRYPTVQANMAISETAAGSGTTTPVVAESSTAGSAQRVERALPERWEQGKPYNANYYYDEPLTNTLPPVMMELSDAWAGQVVKMNIKGPDRKAKWPAVFTSKHLVSNYQNKGTASKCYEATTGKYFYNVVFNVDELHGDEGRIAGYSRKMDGKPTSTCAISMGRECLKNGIMPSKTGTSDESTGSAVAADAKQDAKGVEQVKSSPGVDLTNPDGVGPSTTSRKSKKAKKKSKGSKEATKSTGQQSNPPSSNTRQTTKIVSQPSNDVGETTYPKVAKHVASDLDAIAAGKINPGGDGENWAEKSAMAGVVQTSPFADLKSDASVIKQEVPVKRKQEDEAENSAKRAKIDKMLFGSPESLTSSEDEDTKLQATIDDLRKENQELTEQNLRLQRDGNQAYDELKSQFKTAKVQFLMLAGTTAEIHATIQPLIDHSRNATSLMKKTNKCLSDENADLAERSREFVDKNKGTVAQIVAVANDKIKIMIDAYPKLSKLLFKHDEKAQEAFGQWMAEKSEECAPSPNKTTSAGQQSLTVKQLSEGAEAKMEEEDDGEEASEGHE
ncbi:hypothetical protein BDR22DRAFT_119104 [Usnea florida]